MPGADFFGEQAGGQRVAVDITLEAVKEFQVVATGANAEFGRTASGVVNIITKSGTNQVHGSLFHFQRHENLSSNTSDGKPLKDFHREQFGGTIGGPIISDKVFYFFALERITGNLQRDNLSTQLGTTACPVSRLAELKAKGMAWVEGAVVVVADQSLKAEEEKDFVANKRQQILISLY